MCRASGAASLFLMRGSCGRNSCICARSRQLGVARAGVYRAAGAVGLFSIEGGACRQLYCRVAKADVLRSASVERRARQGDRPHRKPVHGAMPFCSSALGLRGRPPMFFGKDLGTKLVALLPRRPPEVGVLLMLAQHRGEGRFDSCRRSAAAFSSRSLLEEQHAHSRAN